MTALARARKALTALLTAGVVFLTAVNLPGADVADAAVTLIPSIIGAVLVYFTANTPDVPSAKFLVALGAAVGTLTVYLVQHGTGEWRTGLLTFAVAVVGAVITWLTPNDEPGPAHAVTVTSNLPTTTTTVRTTVHGGI